jgi:glutathione synthase/RimK-type ligase-like ATP-grasp enzyme
VSARVAAIGIDTDPTIVHFLAECRLAGFAVEAVNLREVVAEGGWDIAVPDDGTSRIWPSPDGPVTCLSEMDAVYLRPILLGSRATDPETAGRWSNVGAALAAWSAVAPCTVVNRPHDRDRNSVKPAHEALLAGYGFAVAPSVTSCDADVLREFVSDGRAVVKACSGVRGHTRELHVDDLDEYTPAEGPIHLQRLVEGDDVRAHVVGDEVIAVRIESESINYRSGSGARYARWTPPPDLAEALVAASADLELAFTGWDLKLDADGRAWMLEVNPMPGYSHYDTYADADISRALMRLLDGASA